DAVAAMCEKEKPDLVLFGFPSDSREVAGRLLTRLACADISTLSLHDALPISPSSAIMLAIVPRSGTDSDAVPGPVNSKTLFLPRSEEHTSELQSLAYLVCRLLLEKKKRLSRANSCLRHYE